MEELLLWWFKDSVQEGHEPSWEKKDPGAVTCPEGGDEDGGVMDHAREMFKKYDADGGGEIDTAEFTALCYGASTTRTQSCSNCSALCHMSHAMTPPNHRHGFLL